MEERWIDEKEASLITSYTRAAFQAWRWKGGGPPFIKLAPGKRGAVRYRYGDVMEWMQQHPKVRSTSEYPEPPAAAESPAPEPDPEQPDDIAPTPTLTSEQILLALGMDYVAGFRARQNGRAFNPERAKGWQQGWRAADRVIEQYVQAMTRVRVRMRRAV